MEDIKVSVIVPVYNAERYLEECIQSILDQSFRNFELLLVNDGSTDGSRVICEEMAKKDVRIRLIHQDNAGVSAARNKGIKESRGDFICFVDADDIVKTDFLYKMILLMDDEKAGMGICLFEHEGTLPEYGEADYESRMIESRELLKLIVADYEVGGFVCNKIFRRGLLQENGLTFQEDIGYLEDKVFTFLYAKIISQAAFLNEKLYIYRNNPDSTCHKRSYQTFKGKLAAIEKILSADTENILDPFLVSDLQKSYSSAGVWLNVYMFCEGRYDKDALRYQLRCAKKYYPALSVRHKMGYWGLKWFPGLFFLYCKVRGYKVFGKRSL